MPKSWKLAVYQFKKAHNNLIVLIVCMGMVVIPALYAWFNIAASWNPYENTGQLKIAVANNDKGYTSEFINYEMNLGKEVEQTLAAKSNIDYVPTDEEDARAGVASGAYYAAIILPKDFSERLLTILSKDAKPSELTYISNEKISAIAPIVTDKAATAVEVDIERSFVESASSVAVAALNSMQKGMSEADVTAMAEKLDAALAQAETGATQEAARLDKLRALMDSSSNLMSSAEDLSAHVASLEGDVEGALADGTNALSHAETGAVSATQSMQTSIQGMQEAYKKIPDALNKTLTDSTKTVDDIASDMELIASKVDGVANNLDSVVATLKDIQKKSPELVQGAFDAPIERLSGAASRSHQMVTDIRTSIQKLKNGTQDATSVAQTINDDIQDILKQSQEASDALNNKLVDSATALEAEVSNAQQSASQIKNQIQELKADMSQLNAQTSSSIHDAAALISDASTSLNKSAERIADTRKQIHDALESEDTQTLKTVLSANANTLTSMLAAPVEVDREAVYHVENNGSAMAGFYTTLSLWVGAIVLVAMMTTVVDDETAKKLGLSYMYQRYLGRSYIFILLAVLQALLVGIGDLYFLHVQAADPVRFLLTCIFISFIFENIMYALAASFGDVGKAIAVILLVVQVAASGGTFPIQMLAQQFQPLYPYLPFVHAINMLHECIAGFTGTFWWSEGGIMLIYLAGALILGLALRVPVYKLNSWIIEKLEETELM